ncbi:hypothetical protein Tco_1036164, partial [Tanacetum coccineum]
MKLGKVSGASAGRHETLPGGTTPAGWHNGLPSGTLLVGSKGYGQNGEGVSGTNILPIYLRLSFPSVCLTLSWDLEACMVDSFALKMLPELVLDAEFFETDIHKRTKNKAKNDKTEHGME